MSDNELLAGLLELFESRHEAEHVVRCSECDVHADGYEAGPYRCPDNPVKHREALINWVMRRRQKVVWALRGFPPRTKTEELLYGLAKEIERSIAEQLQTPIFGGLAG